MSAWLERMFPTTRAKLIGLALLVVVLRLPALFHPYLDMDETEYAAAACRMLEGGLPYHDVVIIKFPGVLYVYDALFAMFGRYNMIAVHAFAIGLAFATALACRQITRRLGGDDRAGWAAALLYAVFSVGFYAKMQAANCEMLAVLPGSLAVLAYLQSRRGHRLAWCLASGALAGLATICKQPSGLLPVGLALGGLVHAWRSRRPILPELGAGVALGVGTAAVLGALAAYFAARGVLDDAVFWTWTYIFHFYFPSVQDSLLARVLGTPVPLALSMSPAIVLAVFSRGRGETWPAWWWLASMLAAAFTGGRMFGHYFLLAIPALCVLAGIGAAAVFGSARVGLQRVLVAMTAVLALGQLVGAFLFDGASDDLWRPHARYADPAAYVRAHTRPDERIFIWGRSPTLYVEGDRCPSTRFVYAHHLAGRADTPTGQRSHSVPEGWQQLEDDLHAAPPRYILDESHGDWGFEYAPIEHYPALWQLIAERYAFETEIDGVRFYRRAD